MVLLTSSAVSVVLSSGVICLFTFLLFLSGYLLQRNAVDSLRSALEAPLEQRVRVQPNLSPQFQHLDDKPLPGASDENDTTAALVEVLEGANPSNANGQISIGQVEEVAEPHGEQSEPSPQELWHAHVDGSAAQSTLSEAPIELDPEVKAQEALDGRFAYVLLLPSPSDLCSALLFSKWQRQFSALDKSQVHIIFLYPTDWEISQQPLHKEALQLMLSSEDDFSTILHPVQISKVWAGIDIASQLLSELARNPWPYDRVMYLKSPGMLVDTTRLDGTFISTYNDISLLKTSWSKLRPPTRRGGATTLHPDVLLFAQGRGLMTPVGSVEGKLTARAKTSHLNNHDDEVKDEFLAKEAAYILFDEQELEHRRNEKLNHNSIFERFERERGLVCEGTSLLA